MRVDPDTQIEKDFIELIPPTTKNPLEDSNENENSPSAVVKVEGRTFPVTHVLPIGISQTNIFFETVYPLIQSFMESFDVSIVTYGQKGCGKSYTLYGPGFNSVYGEAEQGL